MWNPLLFAGIHICIFQTVVYAQSRISPVAPPILQKNETESQTEETSPKSTEKPKPVLTGDPQKDYIHDPNLPQELNGYDLSDYPFYNRLPENMYNFTCDGRYDGFYASIPHKCQVYHNCLFGIRYDFLCANFTAFDQSNFICHYASVVDCDRSELYYSRNENLYIDPTTTTPPKPKIKIIYRDKPTKDRSSNTKQKKEMKKTPEEDYYYYYENETPNQNNKAMYDYYDDLPTTTSTTTVKPNFARKRLQNLARERNRQGLKQIPRTQGLRGEANQAHGRQQLRRRPGRRRPGGKRGRRRKTTTTTTTTALPDDYYYYYDDDYYYYDDDPTSTTTTTTTTPKPPPRKRKPGKRRRRPRPSSQSRISNRRRLGKPAEQNGNANAGPRGGKPFKEIQKLTIYEDAPNDPQVYEDFPNNPNIDFSEKMTELAALKEPSVLERPFTSRRTGAFRRPSHLRPVQQS